MGGVLVTGARGLLGCTLIPALKTAGHKVISHSRTQQADELADLEDPEATMNLIRRVSPVFVINLVGLTNVDACEKNPQAAYLANVRTVENLVAGLANSGQSCPLLHISTDQVYDGSGPHLEDKITLRNYYAFSKYVGELAALHAGATVLRTNFIGPSVCSARMGLGDWIVAALQKEEQITVFEDVRFSPLSLPTLADMILRVIAQPLPGVFNLGCRGGGSKAEFAFSLAAALKLRTDNLTRGSSASKKMAANRPTNMMMDSTRFETQFGIQLPTFANEIDRFLKTRQK